LSKSGPFSWLAFLIFFHAMLSLFVTISAFGIYAQQGQDEAFIEDYGNPLDLLGLTGFVGVGTLTLSSITIIISKVVGVNPFYSMAYGVVVGIYVYTWSTMFNIFNTMVSSLGANANIGYWFIGILSIGFGLLVLRTLVNMTAYAGD